MSLVSTNSDSNEAEPDLCIVYFILSDIRILLFSCSDSFVRTMDLELRIRGNCTSIISIEIFFQHN